MSFLFLSQGHPLVKLWKSIYSQRELYSTNLKKRPSFILHFSLRPWLPLGENLLSRTIAVPRKFSFLSRFPIACLRRNNWNREHRFVCWTLRGHYSCYSVCKIENCMFFEFSWYLRISVFVGFIWNDQILLFASAKALSSSLQ